MLLHAYCIIKPHRFGSRCQGQTVGESLLYKVKMSGPSIDPCKTEVSEGQLIDDNVLID